MKNVDIDRLFELGISLSAEKDGAILFGNIISEAMDITECDAGTLYILEDEKLHFNYMITKSKGIRQSADRGEIKIPPVPLERTHVCACCALDKSLINISDVYESKKYDFSGAKKYDSFNDYRTKSMLVVPMLDDAGDCIGVLQLINAIQDGEIKPFGSDDERVIRALASYAAVSLNNRLLSEEVKELLHSFVMVMVDAIDTRSPYNANHTKSMVKYGESFIKWANERDCGFKIGKKDYDPFVMSIWLHDIGKLLIPLEIMDKATRLGDKLDNVLHRITVAILMEKLQGTPERIRLLEEIKAFVVSINEAGFLPDDKLEKLLEYAKTECMDENANIIHVLKEDEITALSIRKGTLTEDERKSIEDHVVYTRQMLSGMRFSGRYNIVPKIAASHHELLDGSGYPDNCSKDEISKEARLLTILDIFDALTAEDRPYKPPLPTEKAFSILKEMAEGGKLDKEILNLFRESEVWKK